MDNNIPTDNESIPEKRIYKVDQKCNVLFPNDLKELGKTQKLYLEIKETPLKNKVLTRIKEITQSEQQTEKQIKNENNLRDLWVNIHIIGIPEA